MILSDLIDVEDLEAMAAAGYISRTRHPSEPLSILNYTHRCQYDRAWNDTTRQCRGLIFRHGDDRFNPYGEVVARPWPKFHNYGEHEHRVEEVVRDDIPRVVLGLLDLEAPVEVTDKLDGSLGILYPRSDGSWAVATRGSFTSEQALHATARYEEEYAAIWHPGPLHGFTYLFEIIYPGNRVVLDYGAADDLILLGALENATGLPASPRFWPGPRVETFEYRTLAEALAAPPRPNREGLVVTYGETGVKVKIKQDDYVALHRIMTGTNARNVWEWAAVKACRDLIAEPKHWGSYLGIDPARALELLEVGDGWLEGVPDEFHAWVRGVLEDVTDRVKTLMTSAAALGLRLESEHDGRKRWEAARDHPACKGILRLAAALENQQTFVLAEASATITLACWRAACQAPTAPFSRSEDVA